MVRPVPIVTIDFGEGHVVTRTLHGNVATYICSPDGAVLDVLPGIYDPRAYLDQLGQLRLLFEYVKQGATTPALAEYHSRHADALAHYSVPGKFLQRKTADTSAMNLSKSAIELSFKYRVTSKVTLENDQSANSLMRLASRLVSPARKNPLISQLPSKVPLSSIEDLSNWDALVEDTRLNETYRRQSIHEKLSRLPSCKPKDIMHWLYKEVLHCDIEDPYLGLGKTLFGTNPFLNQDLA